MGHRQLSATTKSYNDADRGDPLCLEVGKEILPLDVWENQLKNLHVEILGGFIS